MPLERPAAVFQKGMIVLKGCPYVLPNEFVWYREEEVKQQPDDGLQVVCCVFKEDMLFPR